MTWPGRRPEGLARDELSDLAATGEDSAHRERIAVPRQTFLELLETPPDCALPFVEFLDLLPALRPRYYSISSAPSASDEAW
jgi:cytochrome P450 / NADPH-cytochrome P450 reductase